MGLFVTHECWEGPYSAFDRWRTHMAELGGYGVLWGVGLDKLRQGETMDRRIRYPFIALDWGHITEENLMGEWDATAVDPLIYLIAHHDHTGVIHPREGALLSLRLEGLLDRVQEDHPVIQHDLERHLDRTVKFIDGLNRAFVARQDVEFL